MLLIRQRTHFFATSHYPSVRRCFNAEVMINALTPSDGGEGGSGDDGDG